MSILSKNKIKKEYLFIAIVFLFFLVLSSILIKESPPKTLVIFLSLVSWFGLFIYIKDILCTQKIYPAGKTRPGQVLSELTFNNGTVPFTGPGAGGNATFARTGLYGAALYYIRRFTETCWNYPVISSVLPQPCKPSPMLRSGGTGPCPRPGPFQAGLPRRRPPRRPTLSPVSRRAGLCSTNPR